MWRFRHSYGVILRTIICGFCLHVFCHLTLQHCKIFIWRTIFFLILIFGSDSNHIISCLFTRLRFLPLVIFRDFSCNLIQVMLSKVHILILKCIMSPYVVAFLTISSFPCKGTDIEEPVPGIGMSYWSVGLPQHAQSVGSMEQHMGELRSGSCVHEKVCRNCIEAQISKSRIETQAVGIRLCCVQRERADLLLNTFICCIIPRLFQR